MLKIISRLNSSFHKQSNCGNQRCYKNHEQILFQWQTAYPKTNICFLRENPNLCLYCPNIPRDTKHKCPTNTVQKCFSVFGEIFPVDYPQNNDWQPNKYYKPVNICHKFITPCDTYFMRENRVRVRNDRF